MGIMSSLRRRAAAVAAAACAGVLALTGCTAFNNSDDGTADGNGTSATTQTFQPSGGKPTATLSIASGSENKEVAVAIQKAADQSNVAVTMHYMGSLEIMNALKAGGPGSRRRLACLLDVDFDGRHQAHRQRRGQHLHHADRVRHRQIQGRQTRLD